MATTTMDNSYKSMPDAQNLDHIPGEYGMPVLGKTFEILSDLHALVHDHYVRFGEVSRVNIGGQRGLWVMGPENLKDIYLDPQRNFSTEMGYYERLGRFFGGGLLMRDFDEHKMHRRIFQSAFKNNAMRGYVDVMNPAIEKLTGQWDPVHFRFFPNVKNMLLQTAATVFLDLDMGSEAAHLNQAFLAMNDGLTAIVRKDLPLPWLNYRRGMEAKRYVHKYIRELIVKKRKDPGADMMSFMVNETTEEGQLFTEEEIIAHVAFLLFGAHDTTTSALTHIMYRLAVHPEWQDKLRAESMALNKPHLSYDDLEGMVQTEHVLLETLRLHPSVQLMTRRTVRECEIGGYRVPANTMLYLPTFFNHRLPEFWTNPEKFDPDRFTPERSEQKRHSFSYLPFGGGPHKCIGMHFAMMQVKLFLHQFLQTYRFKPVDNYFPKMLYVPLPKLADDLPLILEKIK